MQQQQQSQQMMMMPSFPQTNITTDQIQKYLDDNKKLILAIMENQNLGKLAECAQYQALLQKNLMYLAAIADAQPQGPVMPAQMAAHPIMPQGGFYVQHPPAAVAPQQPQPVFMSKGSSQFNSPHSVQQQKIHQHQSQGLAGHIGTAVGSMSPVQIEATHGGLTPEAKTASNVRGGSKPDATVSVADGARSSATGKGSGNGEGK